MERQLQSLGKRWATICHWTEEQWLLLQEVLLKWQSFSENEVKFSDWLTSRELVIDKMKSSDLSDTKVAVAQVQELKVKCLNLNSNTVHNSLIYTKKATAVIKYPGICTVLKVPRQLNCTCIINCIQ